MRPLYFVAACAWLNVMLWALLSQVITIARWPDWMDAVGPELRQLLGIALFVAIGAVLGVAAGLATLLLLWVGKRLGLSFCERLLEGALASPLLAAVVTLGVLWAVSAGVPALLAMTQGPLPPPRRA